ncbi:MAG: hypothetical protein JNM94_10845 [Phycisphaerae bacterium]|nr:hypothetical protein [Phycisphaerae bacterium]
MNMKALIPVYLLLSSAAHGQCMYEYQVISAPPPCPTSPVIMQDLNHHGVAVGYFYLCAGAARSFRWTAETGMQLLDVGPQLDSFATDVNDAGQIAGTVLPLGNATNTAFRWSPPIDEKSDPEGVMELLLEPPVVPGGLPHLDAFTFGNGIGPTGEVFGEFGDGSSTPWPFRWTPGSPASCYCEIVEGMQRGGVIASSETGFVTGTVYEVGTWTEHAHLTHTPSGTISILPTIPGGTSSTAWAVSSNGFVTGWGMWVDPRRGAYPAAYVRAFFWNGATMTLMPPNDLAQGTENPGHMGHGVNALGQVVGTMTKAAKAFLWHDGQMFILRSLVAGIGTNDIKDAQGINDRGQIVCRIQIGTKGYGALLTPIRTRPGDATIDCKVNEKDIFAIFEFWHNEYAYPDGPGDLTGDRFVDGADLAMVLGDWGE